MPAPEQGRVVEVEVLDPQGRNPKQRPVVIVTPTNEIQPGQPFYCVAITSTLSTPLPSNCVLLSFSNKEQSRTGLRKRCAANCDWLVEAKHTDIKRCLGILPKKQLEDILQKIDALE